MDPIRRLTLALLLASVAALRASMGDAPADVERSATSTTHSPNAVPVRFGTASVYDLRRCTERGLGATSVSLVNFANFVQRP